MRAGDCEVILHAKVSCARFVLFPCEEIFTAKHDFNLKGDAGLGFKIFVIAQGNLRVYFVEQPFSLEVAPVADQENRAVKTVVGPGLEQGPGERAASDGRRQ